MLGSDQSCEWPPVAREYAPSEERARRVRMVHHKPTPGLWVRAKVDSPSQSVTVVALAVRVAGLTRLRLAGDLRLGVRSDYPLPCFEWWYPLTENDIRQRQLPSVAEETEETVATLAD